MLQIRLLITLLFIINTIDTSIITKRSTTQNDGDVVSDSTTKCGYNSCHPVNPKQLNIHMIPHSHDDVGWLKTVDQYYYGTYRTKHFAGIQYTIGSVLESLHANPDRRFSQVEIAYLSKWWKHQDERTRKIYIDLVNNGQLEIVNGAWSMNDEATTHYQSIIDQFALGLKFVNETFGECGRPRIGWQIDPFGHSNEMATIFAQLGYDGLIFSRLDYRDRKNRLSYENMEFIWRGSSSLDNKSEIFTSIMYDSYSTPQNFCYDVLCSVDTQPIVDDPDSPEYNLKEKVDEFVTDANFKAKYYKTHNLLYPIGGDFTYQAANMYYTNIEKLMSGIKKFYTEINVIYSTPSCYIKAVNDMAGLPFDLNKNDFMPYASATDAYWTGFYTSRPNLKRLERMGNNLLQATKQLISFDKIKTKKDFSKNLNSLRESMGIMQHHDAITGTEKQLVSQDYVRLLTKGMKNAEMNITETISNLLRKDKQDVSNVKFELASCLLSNVTHCDATKKNTFVVAVYNPLSRSITDYIRLPVDGDAFTINGTESEYQYDIVAHNRSFAYATDIKPSAKELIFKATNIPPHGMQLFYVNKTSGVYVQKSFKDVNYFGDDKNGFRIDNKTNLLSQVTLNGTTIDVKQNLFYYKSYNKKPRPSGAYIFRTKDNFTYAFNETPNITHFRGNLVEECQQVFNNEITQTIRIYKNTSYIEFDWMVGPINRQLNDGGGVEVVSIFNTTLTTSKLFYTDSNGRDMIERQRNFRPTYNYTDDDPITGNYYPVTSRIMLRDLKKNLDFAIVNDRSQGGSSRRDGQIELMLHRRLSLDDDFGVDEPLNELEYGNKGVIARGRNYLTFGQTKITPKDKLTSASVQKDLTQRKHLAPWIFVGDAGSLTLEDAKKIFNFEFSGLQTNLSQSVNILTFEPWTDDTYLLRLEHVFESKEDPVLSQSVDIDLDKLFTFFKITKFRETTIDGNQYLDDNKKLLWNHTNHNLKVTRKSGNVVTLNPMEIRTFLVQGTYDPYEAKNDDDKTNDASMTLSHISKLKYLIMTILIGLIY